MNNAPDQWIRKASLSLLAPTVSTDMSDSWIESGQAGPLQPNIYQVLDLSNLHFTFQVRQSDVQTPNTCVVRIFNLSDIKTPGATKDTLQQIIDGYTLEYTRMRLQAGYENGAFGLIFEGTIMQFRRGRLNATDTFLEIYASDGDLIFGGAFISNSVEAQAATLRNRINYVTSVMKSVDPFAKDGYVPDLSGTPRSIRGKVLFGMAHNVLRQESDAHGLTWSIQNGEIQFIPVDQYNPTKDLIVVNAATGLIGMPEQTDQGIQFRMLLNPKIAISGVAQIDNNTINQTSFPSANRRDRTPYNAYAGFVQLANTATDGFYRIYVVEHTGDTRGQEWYTDVIGLALIKEPASLPMKAGVPGSVPTTGPGTGPQHGPS